ncbi:MAG: S-methyl-5-thioribose-1-phosphate isomerase [Acidaminococcaceae bacterium]
MIKTMDWQGDALLLLDQTKLPITIEQIICHDYHRVGEAIKKLEVRGAPAIGAAAAFGFLLGFKQLLVANKKSQTFWSALVTIKDELIATRPTAINLAWAINKLYARALALKSVQTLPAIYLDLEKLAIAIYDQDLLTNKKIGTYGASVMPESAIVLTHCNAGALATCGWGTALGVIRQTYANHKLKMVYADETRPLLQGSRLTVWELLQDNIPTTLITDNMAAWTMKTKGVNVVVVGADRIAANGDTANKIGTYGVALLAKAHRIPFYIAAPSTTFDFALTDGVQIPIEERNQQEVRHACGAITAPPEVLTYNPAFDVTPNELITGIITEYGIFTAPYQENILKLQQRLLEEENINDNKHD